MFVLLLIVNCSFHICRLKNGSLAFAEGLACAVGAKATVPFAGWHRISKFFVQGVKN
jgi:hypothetical protein